MANGVSISGAVSPITGEEEATLFGVPPATSRLPDVIGARGLEEQPQPQIQQKTGFRAAEAIAPALAGLGAAEGITPTPSAPEAITGTILAGATGAASGALAGATVGLAGGPIGAVGGAIIGGVIGLAAGGVKAFFGLKSSRKADRDRARLIEKADKQRKEDIARSEKWMRINRFDNLQAAKFNRDQTNLQNKWTQFQSVQNNLFNMANREDAAGQNIRNQLRGAS